MAVHPSNALPRKGFMLAVNPRRNRGFEVAGGALTAAALEASLIFWLRRELESTRAQLNEALLRAGDPPPAGSLEAANDLLCLTPRQRQILDLVLDGQPSKNIAADLGISRRTIENHRACIMKKMHAKSLPQLTRTALAATGS